MSARETVAFVVFGLLIGAGVFAMVRDWRKPVEWHRSMVETTYSWLRIGMSARWAVYRAFPALGFTLMAVFIGLAALAWADSAGHIAYTVVSWVRPLAGVLLLVTLSVFFFSRPAFLVFPALRSQPYLLQVWRNPGLKPDQQPNDR